MPLNRCLHIDTHAHDRYDPLEAITSLRLAGGKLIVIGECQKLPTTDELAVQLRWPYSWHGQAGLMALAEGMSWLRQINDLSAAANAVSRRQMPGRG